MKSASNAWLAQAQAQATQIFRQAGGLLGRRSVLAKRKLLVMVFIVLVTLSLFTAVPFLPHLNFGSAKYVIVLGANKGGGVLQWKAAREWELERLSIDNKKDYASRHGYHLAIKDMKAKKRYTHEWRESWEKIDIMRETMRQFPNAEWFWWLDLETFIMEPQRRLEDQIMSHIPQLERNMSYYNPNNVDLNLPYVDESQPVDLIVAQDCGGLNLGSFFMRRTEWSDLLLDVWWDPVFYEQKHMDWVHGEQAALEHLYRYQPWVRSRIGFAPLRMFNSFPPGACADQPDDRRFFYDRRARDFVVNMAGCQYGRDCYNEMLDYRRISKENHRKRFILF